MMSRCLEVLWCLIIYLVRVWKKILQKLQSVLDFISQCCFGFSLHFEVCNYHAQQHVAVLV